MLYFFKLIFKRPFFKLDKFMNHKLNKSFIIYPLIIGGFLFFALNSASAQAEAPSPFFAPKPDQPAVRQEFRPSKGFRGIIKPFVKKFETENEVRDREEPREFNRIPPTRQRLQFDRERSPEEGFSGRQAPNIRQIPSVGEFAGNREDFRRRIEKLPMKISPRLIEKFREKEDEFKVKVRRLRQAPLAEKAREFEKFKSERLELLREKRAEMRRLIEEKRAEFKQKREEMADRFKREVEKIKDERKKEIVERINERLNELNERLTERFNEILDRLETVLTNITTRADSAEIRGVDVSAVRAAIAAAQSVIDEARVSVADQSAKVYDFEIGSEETLRSDVAAARRAAHEDLSSVRQQIKSSFEAVRKASVSLAQAVKAAQLANPEPAEPAEPAAPANPPTQP